MQEERTLWMREMKLRMFLVEVPTWVADKVLEKEVLAAAETEFLQNIPSAKSYERIPRAARVKLVGGKQATKVISNVLP